MTHKTIAVMFDHDSEVNAAAITFDSTALGRDRRQYGIEDASGTVIASITFNDRGNLAQIELLDAAVQIPDSLR